jgi:hypothetical protein
MQLLIFSVDYEIFGNGAGDVRQHVTEPTEAMARLCEKHRVPLTVFFEVEEYLAFEKFSRELTGALGYNPAALIREQIADLSRRGHDIQLHLHPEWYGADYRGGQWVLHPEKQTVDSLFESQSEVTAFIAERKRVIETICPGHKVRAYRAGAFSAQPGRRLLRALADNGFVIDTSVVKGLYGPGHAMDYRPAPSNKGPWRVADEVTIENPAGPIWEFPIYSVMGRRLNQLTLNRLKAKFSKNVPKAKQKEMISQLGLRPSNPFGVFKFLWQPIPIKLDFHNLSTPELMRLIRSAPSAQGTEPDVLMLIGHTKEHIDNERFDELLGAVIQKQDMRVISLDNLAGMLQHTSGGNPGAGLEKAPEALSKVTN